MTGLGPRLDGPLMSLLLGATTLMGALVLVITAVAALGHRSLALVGRFEARFGRSRMVQTVGSGLRGLVERLGYLRPSALPALLFANLLYFANYVGLLVVITRALGAEPLHAVVGAATTYLAFVYVAPTPGASGLAEALGPDFLAAVLAPTSAVAAVLAFRALSSWFQIGVGTLHLLWLGGTGYLGRVARAMRRRAGATGERRAPARTPRR